MSERAGDQLQNAIEAMLAGHSNRECVNALASALARTVARICVAEGYDCESAMVSVYAIGRSMAAEIFQNWGAPVRVETGVKQ